MTAIKALVFNTIFYAILIVYMVVCVAVFLMSEHTVRAVQRHMLKVMGRLERAFGIEFEVRGLEHLPETGALVAVKHQSMYETFKLNAIARRPVFVYKKELNSLPLFGAYLRKLGNIAIDRSQGQAAIKIIGDATREGVAEGKQIIIFPEGTRRPAGAPPAYKFGIAKMYGASGLPVTPAVLNSGLYWSNFFWRGHPGLHVIEFLPPIEPGLAPEVFFETLIERMEKASDRLMLETVDGPNPPALGPEAKARMAEIRGR